MTEPAASQVPDPSIPPDDSIFSFETTGSYYIESARPRFFKIIILSKILITRAACVTLTTTNQPISPHFPKHVAAFPRNTSK